MHPTPGCRNQFHDLTHIGRELVALHLMESPKLDNFLTTYVGPKRAERKSFSLKCWDTHDGVLKINSSTFA